jgi:hypothetical protein
MFKGAQPAIPNLNNNEPGAEHLSAALEKYKENSNNKTLSPGGG